MGSSSRLGALILESGEKFEGLLFGAYDRMGYGEAVFNTSMTGYQEILTDPSYHGQVVCMTVAHVGNTGINWEDQESARIWCSAFIVQDLAQTPSHWRSERTLDQELKQQGIPGLSGVDTRAVTLSLRRRGVERALVLPESLWSTAEQRFRELPRFEGRDLIREVTTPKPYAFKSKNVVGSARFKVVALDYGIKTNLLRSLAARGCEIEVLPATSRASEIMDRRPDGVFLSNGPGDPAAAPYAADVIREILGKVPIFGVCMGHQILSLAVGAKTYKLKFGHRGGNQPVSDCSTQRVEISAHNHGYSVDEKSLPAFAKVSHINLNDGTVEGIELPDHRAFSVQYHPEAAPGPHDSMVLFDRFMRLMDDSK